MTWFTNKTTSKLICWPHGGPHSVMTREFNNDIVFWLKMGYGILRINYRGSLGKFILYHSVFLEHWNSQKSLCNIWQHFSCLLDKSIEKNAKFFFFHGGLFFKSTLSVLRYTWTGRIIWKKFWDIILTKSII